jgi:integrase/recombinase XerD
LDSTKPLQGLRTSAGVTFESAAAVFLARYSSHQTRRTYGATLAQLSTFLCALHRTPQVMLAAVSEDDLLAWRMDLGAAATNTTKTRGQANLARHLAACRSLFAYAHKRRLIVENPAAHLDPPRVRRASKTAPVSPSDLGKIVALLRSQCSDHTTRQGRAAQLAYAVLVTLMTTGLRVGELCSLKRKDLNTNLSSPREPASITLVRKGGRVQNVFLHELSRQVIEEYVHKNHTGLSEKLDVPLFFRSQRTTGSIKPLTPKAVWLMLFRASQRANLNSRPSPHALRAALATELHRQGVLLHQIQDLLGHSSVTTTSLYITRLKQAEESPSLKVQTPHNLASQTHGRGPGD